MTKGIATDDWCRRVTQVDSEQVVGGWLRQIGATDRRPVGKRRKGEKQNQGPPDWVINYRGGTIAVEVTLLRSEKNDWSRRMEIGVENSLCELVKKVSLEYGSPLTWHVVCEYAPEQPPKTMGVGKWEHRALAILRSAASAAPVHLEERLLFKDKIRDNGWGVDLYVTAVPAKENSGLVQVSNGQGELVSPAMVENASAAIECKTKKVRDSMARGERSQHYDKWWLVLDDELLMVPDLQDDEWEDIDCEIRRCPGIDTWSKVVLVSRFQPVHTTQPMNRWYHAFFEDTAHPPLPPCPAWGSYTRE